MTQVTDEMVGLIEYEIGAGRGVRTDRIRTGLNILFNRELISLPVDTDKVREDAIHECLAALPPIVMLPPNASPASPTHYENSMIGRCAEAIKSLLPTKDRAEELAEEYWAKTQAGEWGDGRMLIWAENFARWLIEREGA